MAKTYTRPEFIEVYGGYIADAVKGTGILAGTLISQAIIESQGKVDGEYKVGGSKLAQNSNNYFGIKCHNWSGKGYNISTGEQRPDGSTYVDPNVCFRRYDSVEDSISDYVKFLKDNPRYESAGVFQAKTVREQADALKRAGYATSSSYPSMVTSVYEGVKDYVDKFNKYGVSGVLKSFSNNPIAFVKRNKYAVIGSAVVLAGIGVGTYFLLRKKK
jgi:flagellum-specific peptidoglycan hydrolase FlgJ